MVPITPQVSELLEKALALSTQDRGLLIHELIASLDDEAPEEGVEAAWEDEIRRRVDDIRSGRVKTIPGEQVLAEINNWLEELDQFGPEPFERGEPQPILEPSRNPLKHD